MAFPTFSEIMVSVVVLVIGVPIVYLLSKALKLRPKPITIADPRKESILVFLVVIAVFIVTFGLIAFYHAVINPTFQLDKRPPFTSDVIDVLWTTFGYASFGLPLIIAMKMTRQNLGSIGLSGEDRGRMLALGLILSAIAFAFLGSLADSLGGGFAGFSSSQAYGLIVYAIVGFVEEVIWRGYVQTRVIAFSGTYRGLVATSLLFALWHFPKYYFQFSGVVLEALASALLIFPMGILFGYIMLRSQNLLPSSIFHLFINWSARSFWRIPGF